MQVFSAWCLGCRPGAAKWRPWGRKMARVGSPGIPKGAKTVTIHNPEGLEGFYKELVAALGEDKTQAIAMICAAGGRSARAQRFLAEKGYKNIVDIEEGMLGTYSKPGWIKRGLPTQPYGG